MKKNERYTRLVKFGSAAVILFIEVALYYLVWTYYYNRQIASPFWRRGNWLLVFTYGVLLAFLHRTYGGLKIGYLRRWNLIYSQILAIAIANFFAYVELVLIDKKMHNPGMLLLMTAVDILFVVGWVFLFQWIYNRMFPPRELLVVYGERPVFHIMEKINSRDDKYVLTGAINIDKGVEKIMEEAPKYGGLIIGDIPSHERNIILKKCYDRGIRTYMVPKISDVLIRTSTDLKLFDTPILLSRNDGLQVDQLFFKRILDILTAFLMLVLTSPLFLIFSIAIRCTDRGPVFYRQDRFTKDGKIFQILKFRTMRCDAEKDGIARLSSEEDDRVTGIGKVLRASRLDELPQIFNILHGEMSMVGPRPERPEIAREYEKEIPEFNYRLKVKAGLTGYAQVYGMYNTTPYDKLKLDLTYIRNYSFLLDLKLIFMTPKVMFMKEKTEGVKQGQKTASLKETVYGRKFNFEDKTGNAK
jgi:exopolysaccharide biosynthesis polyprenyl glycosylphosphotransferase